jgi:hypothetical protein
MDVSQSGELSATGQNIFSYATNVLEKIYEYLCPKINTLVRQYFMSSMSRRFKNIKFVSEWWPLLALNFF